MVFVWSLICCCRLSFLGEARPRVDAGCLYDGIECIGKNDLASTTNAVSSLAKSSSTASPNLSSSFLSPSSAVLPSALPHPLLSSFDYPPPSLPFLPTPRNARAVRTDPYLRHCPCLHHVYCDYVDVIGSFRPLVEDAARRRGGNRESGKWKGGDEKDCSCLCSDIQRQLEVCSEFFNEAIYHFNDSADNSMKGKKSILNGVCVFPSSISTHSPAFSDCLVSFPKGRKTTLGFKKR
jgi:hypothetical protein